MRARRLSSWLFLGALLPASRSWAGEPTELVYVRSGRAAACPDQAALERAVNERLGYSAFFRVADRKIVAEIWGTGAALHARARLVEGGGVVRGSREISAPAADCGELIASLALAISITLDPMSASRPPGTTPASAESTAASDSPPRPSVEGPSTSAPPAPAPPPVAPARDVAGSSEARDDGRGSIALVASAGALVSIAALPGATPGLRLGLEGRWAFFSIGIEGEGLVPVSQSSPSGGDARISLLYGSVVPCVRTSWAKGCAVASFGSLRGEGRGVPDARQETSFYAALGLRLEALVPVADRFEFALHAGANKTLTRPSFELAGAEVWRPPPFSAETGFGLVLRFL